MSDNLEIIRTYSKTLSDADLATAWRILYEECEKRGKVAAENLKYTLKKGDIVEWTGRNGVTTGTVHRVKRKKVICCAHDRTGKPDFAARWDIPLTMLRLVKPA